MESNISGLLSSRDENERKKGIVLLAREPSRETLITLEKLAESDESLEVKFFARKAIFCVKGALKPRVIDEQGTAVPLPPNFDFQKATVDEKVSAVQEIINKNMRQNLGFLITAIKHEASPKVVSAIVIAIGKFGGEGEVKEILPFLAHQDSRVRANAIEALEFIGSLKTYPHIFPLLQDTDNRVKANAVKAIGRIDGATSLRILRAMVSSVSPAFQSSAAYAFRFSPAESHVNLLIPLLKSAHESVKRNALETLKLFAEKGIQRARTVLQSLDGASGPLPPMGPDTLQQELSQPHPELKTLQDAMNLTDSRTRMEGIEKAAGDLGEAAAPALLEHLGRETDVWVQGKIFIMLGRLEYAPAIPKLVQGLAHTDARCRANAVEGLGLFGDAGNLKAIVPLLGDSNNRVRGNAVIALRNEPQIDIATPLETMARSPEELMQKTAVFTITELQRPEFYPFLLELEKSPFADVKKSSRFAIKKLQETGEMPVPTSPETTPPAATVPRLTPEGAPTPDEGPTQEPAPEPPKPTGAMPVPPQKVPSLKGEGTSGSGLMSGLFRLMKTVAFLGVLGFLGFQGWSNRDQIQAFGYRQAGSYFKSREMYKDAVNCFEKAHALCPDDAAITEGLNGSRAVIFLSESQSDLKTGRFDEAIARLEKALQLDPKNKELLEGLADARSERLRVQAERAVAKDQLTQALDLLTQSLTFAPNREKVKRAKADLEDRIMFFAVALRQIRETQGALKEALDAQGQTAPGLRKINTAAIPVVLTLGSSRYTGTKTYKRFESLQKILLPLFEMSQKVMKVGVINETEKNKYIDAWLANRARVKTLLAEIETTATGNH